eukprot:SAG11_NODE_45_length_20574_cov_8.004054_6_plen_101_part_00
MRATTIAKSETRTRRRWRRRRTSGDGGASAALGLRSKSPEQNYPSFIKVTFPLFISFVGSTVAVAHAPCLDGQLSPGTRSNVSLAYHFNGCLVLPALWPA